MCLRVRRAVHSAGPWCLLRSRNNGTPVGGLRTTRRAGRLDGRGQAATSFLRGRPRGRLRGTTIPWTKSSPPQTPHGSCRSIAPERHARRTGQSVHRDLAYSTSAGDSAKNSSGSKDRQGSNAPSASTSGVPRVLQDQSRERHGVTSNVVLNWRGFGTGQTKRPRIPDYGVRGLEGSRSVWCQTGGLQVRTSCHRR